MLETDRGLLVVPQRAYLCVMNVYEPQPFDLGEMAPMPDFGCVALQAIFAWPLPKYIRPKRLNIAQRLMKLTKPPMLAVRAEHTMDEFASDGLALKPFAVDNTGHQGVFCESSVCEHTYACGEIGGEAHGYAFAK